MSFTLGGINFGKSSPGMIIMNTEEGIIKDTDKISEAALIEIRTELEDKYMDLNMEIDNCQGCMHGLDEAFDKLVIYKKIVKFLGGNIDKDYKQILERWYKYRKEEEHKLQEEKNKEPFESISIPMKDLILSNNSKDKVLLDLAINYNSLVSKLNEFYKNQNK